MKCDVCGRDMTMPDGGFSCIGVQVGVIVDDIVDESKKQWCREQMMPFDADRQYYVCFPCWLRSLGVKPEGTADE